MLRKHKHITTKELKKDPFVIFTAKVVDYLQDQWLKIISIVIIVGLIISAAFLFVGNRREARVDAYDAAVTAMNNNAPEAPDLLRKVVDNYGGSQYAAQSLLNLANINYQEGNFEDAESNYREYIKKYSGDMFYDFSAYNGLGAILEEQGNFAEAANIYNDYVTKYSQSPFSSLMKLYAGKAHIRGNNYDQARMFLEDVVNSSYDNKEKQKAMYYLAMIE
jgi:TolA-binding protein